MTENIPGAPAVPLFFPSPSLAHVTPPAAASGDSVCDPSLGPAGIQLVPAVLLAMTASEMQQQIVEMLMCLRRQPLEDVAAGTMHVDGTLAIDSMTAVWVISTIGKAFGRHLVRLSSVDRESLCSVGGVAKLIEHAIAPQYVAGAA